MIRKALRVAALCSALPAFAASPPAADAAARPADVPAMTWAAPPSSAPMLMDTAADDSGDDTLDGFDLLTVPEPATLAMLAAGLLGVLGIGYRRRRR